MGPSGRDRRMRARIGIKKRCTPGQRAEDSCSQSGDVEMVASDPATNVALEDAGRSVKSRVPQRSLA